MSRVTRRISVAALFVATVLLGVTPVSALPIIGAAQTVLRDVFGTPPEDETRTIHVDTDVFQDEEIATGPRSAVRIVFKDGTRLDMGERSRLKLTRLVFDADPSQSRLVVRGMVGLFRWVSGTLPPSAYRIDTPVATVGIRGTTLQFYVAEDGTTTVAVMAGMAFVSNLRDDSVTLNPGEATIVRPPYEADPQGRPTAPARASNDFLAQFRQLSVMIGMAGSPPSTNSGTQGGTTGAADLGRSGSAGSSLGAPAAPAARSGGSGPSFGGSFAPFAAAPQRRPPPPQPIVVRTPVPPKATNEVVAVNPPPTRIGTTERATVTVTRVGPGDGRLQGSLDPASGVFSGAGASIDLATDESVLVEYVFAPLVSGAATSQIGFVFNDTIASAGSAGGAISLTGLGVGPVFAASTDALDFGAVAEGSRQTRALQIFNVSQDLGFDDPLTGLTLLDIDFVDVPDSWFEIVGFDPARPPVLSPGESLLLWISFIAPIDADVIVDGLLLLTTDQNGPFGSPHDVFAIALNGTGFIVPEPPTLLSLLGGLVLIGAARRRISGGR